MRRDVRPGIRRLFRLAVRRPDRAADEMDDEIRLHLALRAEQLIAEGRSAAEARAEAVARFGPTAPARLRRSAVRREERMRTVEWLDALWQDVRYAARGLRRAPAFTAVAVLTLALGIGANAAIFGVVNAVMLRSLPVRAPERLVRVTLGSERNDELSNVLYERLRERADAFDGLAAFAARRFDLAEGGESRGVDGTWVSGAFFDLLGVGPALGRVLRPDDDRRGCAPVAVLAHRYWRSAYGGDPGVVGRTIALDGHPFEIVGVAAPTFTGVEVGRAPQLFAPLCATAVVDGRNAGLDDPHQWFLRVIGRLRGGLTAADATRRLQAIAPAVFTAALPPDAGDEERQAVRVNTLGTVPAATGYSAMRLQYRGALVALMGVVGLVLLIACANVANLLLARAASRRRELAIRLGIGAGRGRLARQLLTESALLAAMGGAAGLLVARWAGAGLVALLPARDAVWLDLAVDGRVLAFTLATSAATALLFGAAPAWRAARLDPRAAMAAGDEGAGGARPAAGRALVAGQIALSLVLLLGAGLLLGTFRTLLALDPGFRRDGVLLASVDLRAVPEARLADVRRALVERVRATPGVAAAGASLFTPISGAGWNGAIGVDGRAPTRKGDGSVFFNAVSDGWFATLGTRLVAGRDFAPGDGPGAPPVVIVNEAAVRKYFGGAGAVGRRVAVHDGPGGGRLAEVVGVVRDTKYGSLREETRPLVFLPLGQDPYPGPQVELVVRGAAPLAPAVTAAAADVGRRLSLRYTTLAEQVDASLGRERLLATLSACFGALALLLAVVGLYGTTSYALARRRRELGVRVALGAARGRVMRLVLGDVARLVAAGVAVGGVAGAVGVRWVAPFLFGRTPADPATWVLSVATLAAAALAAGAIPAWRAASADPVQAIRAD